MRNGELSFWHASLGGMRPTRPPLPESTEADVCIVGAGLTGLWAAYYLRREDPSLRIVVLDAEHVGFGASGRNGGWLSGELAGSRDTYAKAAGSREPVVKLQRAMFASVDEVIDVLEREGIDADVKKGGTLYAARTPAQLGRLREHLAYEGEWGFADEHAWLEPAELEERIRMTGALAAIATPHCARVHPAKLVRGVGDLVERMGVTIHEATRVTRIDARCAHTPFGTVRARHVLRCTEGFTASLAGQRRTWLPMNSSMIATAPIPAAVWDEIGWQGAETLSDGAHAYFYAQRTADDRIAIGGRGVPYRYGSRTDNHGRTQERTARSLQAILTDLFPATAEVEIDHAWCGVLGVPRDWCTTVGLDPATGLGWAGGYVGSGLTTTNLAGRTLADLVRGEQTELTGLAWVNRRPRKWEPEPLRYLGVHGLYALYRAADARERRGLAHTSRLARVADLISGK